MKVLPRKIETMKALNITEQFLTEQEQQEAGTVRIQNSWSDPNGRVSAMEVKAETDAWVERLTKIGGFVGLQDYAGPPRCEMPRHVKVYWWFCLACCFYSNFGWIVAFVWTLRDKDEAMPDVIGWLEIKGDGTPKTTFGALGVVLLTLIPPAGFLFRPSRARFCSYFEQLGEMCPQKSYTSAVELAAISKFCVVCASLVPLLGVTGGLVLNFINLGGNLEKHSAFILVIDTIVLVVYWVVSQTVVGHTAMLYNYHIMYCRKALQKLRINVSKLSPMQLVAKHAVVQKRIHQVGEAFGLYLGSNLILCILASSVFAGRIPHEKFKDPVDFFMRVFFQLLFIMPTIYSLYKTGQLGTEGEHIIREFMKCDPKAVNGRFDEYNFAINYFALKLRTGEVGLRMYDFPLTYKTITQVFSIWVTLLSMSYSIGQPKK